MAAVLLLAGCGTAVYTHTVEIALDDAAARAGAPPVTVSLFDKQMGYSMEWALRQAGAAAPGRPYVGTVTSTATVMFWDMQPPERLDLSFVIPSFENRGYYFLPLEPRKSSRGTAEARFITFGSYFPEGAAPVLKTRYVTQPLDKGWHVGLTVEIPPP